MLVPILQISGLVLDLFGVILMAIDIVKIDPSTGTWGGLKNAKAKAKKSRKFTLWGLGFIGLGFGLQIISTLISYF